MPHEIVRMLERCGFVGVELFGSADGERYERLSKRLIIRAHRPA
jgi:hypothetical protein